MSAQVVGLWLGGAISVEAAQMVEEAVRSDAEMLCRDGGPAHAATASELHNLANAIRAQIQRTVPADPADGLI